MRFFFCCFFCYWKQTYLSGKTKGLGCGLSFKCVFVFSLWLFFSCVSEVSKEREKETKEKKKEIKECQLFHFAVGPVKGKSKSQ